MITISIIYLYIYIYICAVGMNGFFTGRAPRSISDPPPARIALRERACFGISSSSSSSSSSSNSTNIKREHASASGHASLGGQRVAGNSAVLRLAQNWELAISRRSPLERIHMYIYIYIYIFIYIGGILSTSRRSTVKTNSCGKIP